jgi:hypothetical protein
LTFLDRNPSEGSWAGRISKSASKKGKRERRDGIRFCKTIAEQVRMRTYEKATLGLPRETLLSDSVFSSFEASATLRCFSLQTEGKMRREKGEGKRMGEG